MKAIYRRFAAILSILLCLPVLAMAQSNRIPEGPPVFVPSQPPARRAILCGRMIDVEHGRSLKNVLILIDGDKIASVTLGGTPPAGVPLIDLSHATVLPGLIDAHEHMLFSDLVYSDMLLKDSIPYRAILATRDAKIALDDGFTTVRDLETEGAMYADVDLQKAIDRGMVPGPRMQVATRAMAPTGMYPLLLNQWSWELHLPHGVQVVDGVENARKAVREQIGHGANWIKVYCDHDYTFGSDGSVHGIVDYTPEEMHAIVDEAHRLHTPVACHAMSREGIAAALKAGVDSIEHGAGATPAEMDEMVKRGIYWVPTILAEEYQRPGVPVDEKMIAAYRRAFTLGLKKSVKIAFGTDQSGFMWTAFSQAKGLEFYVTYGMTPMRAIQSATIDAARLMRWSDRVGSIEPGEFADIIAVSENPLQDISQLEHVKFVMKGGIVYKNDFRQAAKK